MLVSATVWLTEVFLVLSEEYLTLTLQLKLIFTFFVFSLDLLTIRKKHRCLNPLYSTVLQLKIVKAGEKPITAGGDAKGTLCDLCQHRHLFPLSTYVNIPLQRAAALCIRSVRRRKNIGNP